MFAVASLLALVSQVSGTPYISGGDSPAGTDCSGLASWVSNAATNRPVFGDRFHTGNQESALLARGFRYGTQPGALNIGWNSGHTAVTLPDGTPVSSGEGGGVKIGGGGAFQPQFTKHMHLPADPAPAPAPEGFLPPPPSELPPPLPADAMAPAPLNVPLPPPVDPMAPPPPPADPMAPPPAPEGLPPTFPL
ncbi:glycoside hydrolase [Mycolicibacterium diernhoferi]|uniref:Glycoside hydrolase n=1 Tax=Mycolicibacterium diernhoferi TaxID=1801 RepID=A0A1Q4H3S4_9MYCO|nr:glycoside hydrolase [Mycolicibacterium diernhoferi]OJZ60876.1 glycoside hydrolase [Mycolicibacterium diernhoferi]OPE48282.1 glycoside hydrolase [Mycolicibacterium diernhoferi]PEG54092.1 glycoside hydrolase [Mycolicibacterium diernhoferi]QYL20469.1 C40 family peptidase [Mycolicibacterium diernhoferi]